MAWYWHPKIDGISECIWLWSNQINMWSNQITLTNNYVTCHRLCFKMLGSAQLPVGQSCIQSCRSGFIETAAAESIVCNVDLSVGGTRPTCESVTCNPPGLSVPLDHSCAGDWTAIIHVFCFFLCDNGVPKIPIFKIAFFFVSICGWTTPGFCRLWP